MVVGGEFRVLACADMGARNPFFMPHYCKTVIQIIYKLYILPSTDNCWRENKNRYILSFLASLVELNVFVEAGIDFLIKGHTGI